MGIACVVLKTCAIKHDIVFTLGPEALMSPILINWMLTGTLWLIIFSIQVLPELDNQILMSTSYMYIHTHLTCFVPTLSSVK